MTAMRVEELPAELGAGLLGTGEAVQPDESAVTRAAVRWTQRPNSIRLSEIIISTNPCKPAICSCKISGA